MRDVLINILGTVFFTLIVLFIIFIFKENSRQNERKKHEYRETYLYEIFPPGVSFFTECTNSYEIDDQGFINFINHRGEKRKLILNNIGGINDGCTVTKNKLDEG